MKVLWDIFLNAKKRAKKSSLTIFKASSNIKKAGLIIAADRKATICFSPKEKEDKESFFRDRSPNRFNNLSIFLSISFGGKARFSREKASCKQRSSATI